MVEFALVLPILMLLIFGGLYFGFAMHAKINSTHLTAEGARYIAVNQNPGPGASPPTTMEDFIRNRAATNFLKQATVCIEYPLNPLTSTSGMVGDPVRVTMSRDYPITDFIGKQLTPAVANLPVSSQTTMRLEALPTNIPAGCTT